MRVILSLLLLIFSGVGITSNVQENASPDWKNDTLSGDWSGLRGRLYKAGIDVGIVHKSDVFANVSGGLKRGSAWLGHSEVSADFDLEKLFGWDATSFSLLYHSNLGSKFNKHYVGSLAGVDNIEVLTNTAQFYYAYLQKSWGLSFNF